jgi:hypothetical protein
LVDCVTYTGPRASWEGGWFRTTETGREIYRIAIFVPGINLEFSHFLIRDEEPLLFPAGLRGMFALLRQEISRLMDPSKIRHLGLSHFESDECGGLNEWLQIASAAEPVCGLVGAMVSVNDFAIRPARALSRDDVFSTGSYRFRFIPTPHVPQGWDASEAGPLANCVSYTHHTGLVLHKLADLDPEKLAGMHGSSYSGDGRQALQDPRYGDAGCAWSKGRR